MTIIFMDDKPKMFKKKLHKEVRYPEKANVHMLLAKISFWYLILTYASLDNCFQFEDNITMAAV